jgi:hypothetical protein
MSDLHQHDRHVVQHYDQKRKQRGRKYLEVIALRDASYDIPDDQWRAVTERMMECMRRAEQPSYEQRARRSP